MNGATREEAVEHLLGLGNEVTIRVEHLPHNDDYANKGAQPGDSFYIRYKLFLY